MMMATLLVLLFYTWFLYPVIVRVAGRKERGMAESDGQGLRVSVLFSAYNEEGHVAARLENLVSCRF